MEHSSGAARHTTLFIGGSISCNRYELNESFIISGRKKKSMASTVRLRILAFGASLTEGCYVDLIHFHPYTHRLSQLFQSSSKPVDIDNAGVSGEAVLSTTMLPRLKNLLASATAKKKPFDWILLLAGTNDTMRDQEKAPKVFDGYQLLINECHQHGARILSMTLPEASLPKESPFDRERQQFNRLIKEELIKRNPEKKIVVLDVEQQLPQSSLTNAQREQIWADEIHLTPKGYDRLGELIYQAMQPHLS